MTRDAKIGLLTGLGVIVLIGVLLSNYLGGGAASASGATGRMARLPNDQAYRDQVMQPVGVPGMARTDAPVVSSGQLPVTQAPMQAYATDPGVGVAMDTNTTAPGQPLMGSPVMPVPAGMVMPDPKTTQWVPTIHVDDAVAGAPKAADKPVASGKEYKIVPGDSLEKISKKFYKSTKVEDEQRIVAANPTVLKDMKTTLVVGKTLIIPDMPVSVADAGKSGKVDGTKVDTADTHGKAGPVVIRMPGAKAGDTAAAKGGDSAAVALKIDTTKKDATTTYEVKAGDTLDKIAKKVSAKNFADVAKQIVALNKLKDPDSLQVGMKLKLPVVKA